MTPNQMGDGCRRMVAGFMSKDLDAAGGPLALFRLAQMHPDNLHPDANAIVPFVDPAKLDPIADDDQPGYMPTIDVIRIVRQHRDRDYIRRLAVRNGYRNPGAYPPGLELEFDNCVAVEIACREILDANRWMLAAGAARDTQPPA